MAAVSHQEMQHPKHQHEAEESEDFSDEEAGCMHGEEDKRALTDVDVEIRTGFVRKVYSILTVQIVITIAIAGILAKCVGRDWLMQNMWLYYLSFYSSLGIVIGMACCCRQMAREFPTNYLMLFTFTVFEAVLMGFVTSLYESDAVLKAGAVTTFVFLGLTAYACTTSTDFTGMGPYLFAVLVAIFCWGLIGAIFGMGDTMHTIYAICGTLLFCVYIVYDTQLITGGRHKKFSFSVDDYVFAALNLYLDIINLFMFILSLLGGRSD